MDSKIENKTIKTSRNFIPKVFKKYKNELEGQTITNFGAGRFPERVDSFLVNYNIYHYEPYWDNSGKVSLSGSNYQDLLDWSGTVDQYVLVCSNVLNVLEDPGKVIDQICSIGAYKIYIQIYEGDRTGKGSETRDGYKRNAKTASYMPLLPDCYKWNRKGNVIIGSK